MIKHQDFRTLKVENVDLVLTDPPYAKRYLPLWDDLGAWAAKALRPGGVLVSYAGSRYLPEVLEAMTASLTYRGTIAIVYQQPRKSYPYLPFLQSWKAVLVFSHGKWQQKKRITDVIDGRSYKKKWHKWEQSLGEVCHLVERFSEPGQLVADPFSGGGTVAQACTLLGRKWVATDIDKASVDVGNFRIVNSKK